MVSGDVWGEMTTIQFTTGSGDTVSELSEPPTGELKEAILYKYDGDLNGSIELTLDVESALDPQELSVITVSPSDAPDEIIHIHRVGEDNGKVLFAWYYTDAPFAEEACVVVRQRDGAGRVVENQTPICRTLEVQAPDATMLDGIDRWAGLVYASIRTGRDADGTEWPNETRCQHVEVQSDGVDSIDRNGGRNRMQNPLGWLNLICTILMYGVWWAVSPSRPH